MFSSVLTVANREFAGTLLRAGETISSPAHVSHLLAMVDRMAKASRVLAALKRDGWIEIRRSGSHRTLQKGGRRVTWSHHHGDDLGSPMMARIAKSFGYTLDELRRLL